MKANQLQVTMSAKSMEEMIKTLKIITVKTFCSISFRYNLSKIILLSYSWKKRQKKE